MRQAILVLLLIVSSCAREPPYPVIWSRPELSSGEVQQRFGKIAPSYKRIAAVADVMQDARAIRLLSIGGLLGPFSQLPGSTSVELLAWEGAGGGEKGQFAVGVFNASSGAIVTVSGSELFFIRAQVSSK